MDYLVIAAIERDQNTVRQYDIGREIRLATLKLVGYTEVVHALASRLGGKCRWGRSAVGCRWGRGRRNRLV